MVTAAAAIVLSERLGFDVELNSGRTSKETYAALATGEVHAAMEMWPVSNRETFMKYVGKNTSSSIHYYPYGTLFGRSGIFETCSRTSTDADMSKCSSGFDIEPILR
jgi:ABC-type proline/glycine betaine transport system substrate-binding protein